MALVLFSSGPASRPTDELCRGYSQHRTSQLWAPAFRLQSPGIHYWPCKPLFLKWIADESRNVAKASKTLAIDIVL